MIHLDCLDAFTADYAQCDYEPLRVVFHMRQNSRIVDYNPIHLDGLIARGVVERATEGRLLSDAKEGYWIPLPLEMLWYDEGGYPLWAASVLYPVGPTIEDVYIRHKRNPDGALHDHAHMQTSSGPWMERRLPTPIKVCNTLEARCMGNKKYVSDLLSQFTHLGKLRLGRIEKVIVTPGEYDQQDIYEVDGKLIKPIPEESGFIDIPETPGAVGWTPPFWKPAMFRPGWAAGTRLGVKENEWFAAI